MYVVLPAWKKTFLSNPGGSSDECVHHPRSNEADLSSFFIARRLHFLIPSFIWRRVSKWLVCHFPRKKIESPKRWMALPHFCHRQPFPNIRRQSAGFSHFLLTRGDRIFGDLPNQASPKHSRKWIMRQNRCNSIFFLQKEFCFIVTFSFQIGRMLFYFRSNVITHD